MLRQRVATLIANPQTWCMSGDCPDTNWGGTDRLHYRGAECPPFSQAEVDGWLKKLSPKS